MFVCTTEDSEAPAAARRRLSCHEWDSFANPFPCPQGGFGDFRGEVWRGIGLEHRGLLRPLRGSGFALGQPDDFVAGASQHSRPKWFYRAEASMMRRRVLPRRSIDDAQAGFASRVVGRRPSFRPVVKDQSPLRGNPCGLGLGRAPDSVALCRPEQHVPSPTAGKNGGVSGEKPIHCAADIVFTQCFQGRKNLSLFSACPRMSVLGRRCRSMSARRAKP